MEFEDDDAAQKSISLMNGKDLKGRPLRVNEAENRPPRPAGMGGAPEEDIVRRAAGAIAPAPAGRRPTPRPPAISIRRSSEDGPSRRRAAGGTSAGASAASISTSSPPPTRTDDVVDVRHGVEVRDPVPLARGRRGGRGRACGRRRRAATRAPPSTPIPFATAIRERLRALFSIGLVSAPVVRGEPLLPSAADGRPGAAGPLRAATAATAPTASCSTRPTLAEDRTSALDWYYPSDDGRLLAYGVSEGGSEKSVLRVRDVESRARPRRRHPRHARACSLEWRPDGSGLLLHAVSGAGHGAGGRGELSTGACTSTCSARDWREDPLVFGGDRPPEDWPNVHLSPDGRWLAVSVSRGWTRTDVYLRDLTAAGAGFTTVIEGVDAIFGVELRNDRLYLQTNLDAPRSRLVRGRPPSGPGRESWRDVLPRDGRTCSKGRRSSATGSSPSGCATPPRGSPSTTLGGARIHEVALPVIGSVAGLTGEWDGDEAFLGFTSYAVPPDRLSPRPARAGAGRSGRARPATWTPTASACGSCATPRATARLVSMFLVDAQRPPHRRPGRRPPHRLRRVQREPHARVRPRRAPLPRAGRALRGGPPARRRRIRRGVAPRRACSTASRTCSTISSPPPSSWCARGTRRRTASPSWAAATAASWWAPPSPSGPDLFRAVVCQVPLLDMVRYHLFRIARLWIPEYGSADDAGGASAGCTRTRPTITSRDGTPYPAVLLTTGESDSRVDPLHARKMAARLQAATSSAVRSSCAIETRAGHGQGKPLSKALEEWADVWTFVFAELGPGGLTRPERPAAEGRCINIGRDGTPPRPPAPGRAPGSPLRRRTPAPGPPPGDAAAHAPRRRRARRRRRPPERSRARGGRRLRHPRAGARWRTGREGEVPVDVAGSARFAEIDRFFRQVALSARLIDVESRHPGRRARRHACA